MCLLKFFVTQQSCDNFMNLHRLNYPGENCLQFFSTKHVSLSVKSVTNFGPTACCPPLWGFIYVNSVDNGGKNDFFNSFLFIQVSPPRRADFGCDNYNKNRNSQLQLPSHLTNCPNYIHPNNKRKA